MRLALLFIPVCVFCLFFVSPCLVLSVASWGSVSLAVSSSSWEWRFLYSYERYIVCSKFWADYHFVIYTHCWELMKLAWGNGRGRHCRFKVTFWYGASDTQTWFFDFFTTACQRSLYLTLTREIGLAMHNTDNYTMHLIQYKRFCQKCLSSLAFLSNDSKNIKHIIFSGNTSIDSSI